MKVIKRDGHMVDYCPEKIEQAILKANKEVEESEQASNTQIRNIIKYIESLGKKRILVEDIQDIIEMKLMSIGKYQLAKKYITICNIFLSKLIFTNTHKFHLNNILNIFN